MVITFDANFYATLITIIFIFESFWEISLYSWLQRNQKNVRDPQTQQKMQRTLQIESKWNWGSWILIILLLVVPDSWVLPFGCLLVLFETLVIKRMDNLKTTIQNQVL